MNTNVQLDCYGASDPGRSRTVNDDQFLIGELSKSLLVQRTSLSLGDATRWPGRAQGQLLLVADGIGTRGSSERASAVAVETAAQYVLNLMPWFFRLDAAYEDDLRDELKQTMETCQQKIRASSGAHRERRGMGTSLTMGYLLWPRLYVVHVGNTRCYLYREKSLSQITTDHTVAEQLSSKTKEKDVLALNDVLWNTVGGSSDDLYLEVRRVGLKPGDAIVLCTDGLTRHVEEGSIGDVLAEGASAESVCHELIDTANRAGGSDNVTVVVGHFRDPLGAGVRCDALEAGVEGAEKQLSDRLRSVASPARATQASEEVAT